MKVMVIGGNRFSGKALVEKLVAKQNSVHVFNRSGTAPTSATIIKGDRNCSEDLKKLSFGDYDCVVDMCLYNLRQFRLIQNMIAPEVNYVFVSSGAVDYPKSFGEYGRCKIEVENALKDSNLNYKILRPSYIVGKNDHKKRLDYYINCLKTGSEIEVAGTGDCPINLVFVQDVVNCLYELSADTSRSRSSYYAASDSSTTVNEMIGELKKILGITNHSISYSLLSPPFLDQRFEFDNSLIKKDYGIRFTDLAIGIKDYTEEVYGR